MGGRSRLDTIRGNVTAMRADHRRGAELVVLAAGLCLAAPAAAADAPYVSGEAVVRFEPGVTAAQRADVRRDAGVQARQGLGKPGLELVDVGNTPVSDAVADLET